jgi:D-inositol-3-phosphate glycosyltransferase
VNLHVAMLSVHTCPLAALGGKETGGMNVYVREVSRELGRMGMTVDVFTRSQNPTIPRGVARERARVIHLPAGDEAPMAASASTSTWTSSSTASRRGGSPGRSTTT